MGRYRALQKPGNYHSFESGVLEQGNIYNMQDRGPEDQGWEPLPYTMVLFSNINQRSVPEPGEGEQCLWH